MSVPQYWRKISQNYKLEASKCKACNAINFPKQAMCKKCGKNEMETINLPEKGVIKSFSVIYAPPKGFGKKTPYVIGLVELENKVLLTTQITDCDPEDIKIGTKVEFTFRKMKEDGKAGIIQYGYKFRPLIEEAQNKEA
ncbi:MAG: Zn-ribbon domain-containing OB-fold protein [Candidatus Ranarchaeia archaeon]